MAAYCNAHQRAISTNIKNITESLELLIQQSSPQSTEVWAKAMHESGLFLSLFNYAVSGKVRLPRRVSEATKLRHFVQGSTSIICDHFYIFSRMVLQDPKMFINLVIGAATARGEPAEQTLDILLDQWWRNVGSCLIRFQPVSLG